jgi:membrane protein
MVELVKLTWQEFQRHNAVWLAAALAYFAAFTIAPLVIVTVEIAGLVIPNRQHVLDVIYGYLNQDVGTGAGAVRQIVTAMFDESRRGLIAQILGWLLFTVGALGLFSSLQFALNTTWDVPTRQASLLQSIRQRALSFAAMLLLAVLLLVSIGVNALLVLATNDIERVLPDSTGPLKAVDFFVSLATVWIGFTILFALLPDRRIHLRDVWVGAGITAFLFVVGQMLLGWYLGRASLTSVYGAFGSLVIFLLWVNYSAQIVLFGAEFTQVYARWYRAKKGK